MFVVSYYYIKHQTLTMYVYDDKTPLESELFDNDRAN